ncbi:MAG: SRPBCC family protein [Solirubrobacterales bacterium]
MAELPDNYAVATGFVPASSSDAWALVSDLENWSAVFPEWIASIEFDEDRYTATGPSREKYDLYVQSDPEEHTLDVETVDELGSADTLKLRILDIPGGSLVLVAHGKLSGTSPVAWEAKRDAVAAGLSGLSLD